MPAMLKALAMQEKARGCGFDWEKREDVWDKVLEELREVREASRPEPTQEMTSEFGDLLFAVLNAARLYGVDAEAALSATCSKFRRRFDYVEAGIRSQGRTLADATLADMDALWDAAKAQGL